MAKIAILKMYIPFNFTIINIENFKKYIYPFPATDRCLLITCVEAFGFKKKFYGTILTD